MRRKISKLGIIIPILAIVVASFFIIGAGPLEPGEPFDPDSGDELTGELTDGVETGTEEADEPDAPDKEDAIQLQGISPSSAILFAPMSAEIYGGPVGGGSSLDWSIDDEGTLIISGSGEMPDFDNLAGTAPPWVYYSGYVRGIVIESGVTSIGAFAFSQLNVSDSSGTLSVNYPILTDVVIADTVTTIGESSFYNCASLTDIVLPDGLTTIGDGAFYGCTSLTTINIPDSVTDIGNRAFFGCTSLTTINIPDGVTIINSYTFQFCESLMSVVLPDSLTTIVYGAFNGCTALTDIVLPDSLTTIGDGAFYGCTSLTTINIPDGVTIINSSTFYQCESLMSVVLPDSVTTIGNGAFYRCSSLTTINIPDSVTFIGDGVFANCDSLTAIIIDADNQYYIIIDGVLFDKAQTELIHFPTGKSGDYVIPDGVIAIYGNAFANSGVTSVKIPDSVTTIGDSAFQGCLNLTSIEIPDGVTTIGGFAFQGCSNLTSFTFGANSQLTEIRMMAFAECESLTNITIPDSVTIIANGAFINCSNLSSVTFGANSQLIRINANSFEGCISLTNIAIPDSVTSIDLMAFGDCSNLSSVTFGANSQLNYIGGMLFYSCTSLTNITIPDSVERIRTMAFSGCDSLVSVVLGSGISAIDDSTFSYCPELLHVVIPVQGAFTIDDIAFDNSPNVMIWAPYSSGVIEEAERLDLRYAYIPTSEKMQTSAGTLETVYKNVPFEFVPVTGIQDNYSLVFDLQGTLPAGLYFNDGSDPNLDAENRDIPGTIYGVPETPGSYDFTMYATPKGLEGIYSASATFTLNIADPLDPVDGLDFEEEVYSSNDEYEIAYDDEYDIDGHIGILNEEETIYEITGYRDEVEDQILYIGNAPFELFAGLWINGEEQRQSPALSIRNGYDYYAEEGSTRVTIFAQTIQDLDNGEYIAVAAFRVNDGDPVIDDNPDYVWLSDFENMLDVVAQKFYIDLSESNNNTNYGDNTDYGGYTDPGNTNTDGGDRGQDTGVSDQETGGTTLDETTPDGTAQPGSTASGTTADGTAPGNTATQPADTTTADGTATDGTAATGTAPPADGAPAAGTTANTPTDNAQPGTDPANTSPTNNAPTGSTPSGSISGLPTGPDGKMYFNLDGSGNPMELRIDIPFGDFNDLYFDGALWTDGTDYSAREGSTILTITAAQLEKYDEGEHSLTAGFANETVEISFLLNKPAAAAIPPSAPSTAPAPISAPADITMPAQNSNILPFIIAGVAVLIIAAAAILIARKKRAA